MEESQGKGGERRARTFSSIASRNSIVRQKSFSAMVGRNPLSYFSVLSCMLCFNIFVQIGADYFVFVFL